MTADTRTPGQSTEAETKNRPSAAEIMRDHGLYPTHLQFKSDIGSSTIGPMIDEAARDMANASGLNVLYEVQPRDHRLISPNGQDPERTIKQIWDENLRYTSLYLQMSFHLGADIPRTREAVAAIVEQEGVPIVIVTEEAIRPSTSS